MSRSLSWYGISPSGTDYIDRNAQREERTCSCPNCENPHVSIIKEEKGEYVDAFYDSGNNLKIFTLQDGTKAYEYIQEEPFASGPCIFTALKNESGEPIKETLWTPEEIKEYLGDSF